MKVLVPVPRQDFASLVFTGIALSNHPAWSTTTNYVVGDQVYRGESEYIAVAPSLNVDPAVVSESPVWFRTGAINRLKVFDETIYDQAVGDPAASYTAFRIESPTTITSVAVFNVEAREVQAILTDKASGSQVASYTISLVQDDFVTSWADYFYEPPTAKNEALFDNLLVYPGTYLHVRFYASGTAAKIGQIVVGRSYPIGDLNEDSTIGIQDYSRKERDEWGNPIIVERPWSQRAEYDLSIPSRNVRQIQNMLSKVRARPAVYFDDDDPDNMYGTTVYGYYQDFSVNLKVGDISHMTLEVEGLV